MSIQRMVVKKYRRGCCALIFLISVLASANPQVPLQTSQSSTDLSAVDSSQNISPNGFLNNLSDVDLVDQYSQPFHSNSLVNHVVLFNFIFTRCGSTCPLQTKSLAQVFTKLPADIRDQVRFVSVSIDPDYDTPAQLQRFSKTMDADHEGWLFLTGDVQHIEKLTQRLHIFDESESGTEFDGANKPNKLQIHRTSLWLVDKQGRMLQRYQGDPPDKERLIRELTQVSHLTVH